MKPDAKDTKVVTDNRPTEYVLLITFIGAAIYFIKLSTGFWGFILAILKAAVWPAFLIYDILKVLNS